MTPRCPACAKPVGQGKRFCGNCGYRLDGGVSASAKRAVLAILCVFGGVLVSLAGSHILDPVGPASDVEYVLDMVFTTLAIAGFGFVAVFLLGQGAWRQSLGGTSSLANVGLGLLVGIVGLGVSHAYVTSFAWLVSKAGAVDDGYVVGFAPSFGALFLTSVVIAPLIEEWTDRGVLWVALRRVVGPAMTIACTALLFGLAHGLGGGGPFEVPHRFAVGLGLGWVRHRSGSLWPGIAGHALLNVLALTL